MSGGSVYFIECAGRIKIGYSTNTERRLRGIANAAPRTIRLIGTVEGSRRAEAAIHRHLESHRVIGEWFHDCEPVRSVIGDILRLGVAAIGFSESKSDPVRRIRNEEFMLAVQRVAEPITFRDSIKDAIGRVAGIIGLSYWRTFDIWYGKARRIEIEEARKIEAALRAQEARRAA